MKRFSLAVAIVSCAGVAVSQGYAEEAAFDETVSFAYADVLSAEALYEEIRSIEPREECVDQQVRRNGKYDNTNTGAVVGAIAGATAGNQVGGGDGRRAATVAGAVIGGLIGREVDAQNNPRGSRTEVRRECRTVETEVSRREVVGYDVQYRYRGEVYMSQLDFDPGAKLRIRVAISPALQ